MKTNIKKSNITDGLFVHNMLCELANGCSAVQAADSFGQHGIISQELYDYVYELIGNGELMIRRGWIVNVHNSVGFSSHNESHFFTYEGELTPFEADPVHPFCMVKCSYTVFEGGFKFDKRNEKTYNLYIPWYDVQIDQIITGEEPHSVSVEVKTPIFARAMPVNEYAKLMEMISKYSFIPQLSIEITYFNKSGIEKIEKKMLELALEKYKQKPE